MTHSYVMPLLELVLSFALMFQSCACRVIHCRLLPSWYVSRTLVYLKCFIILCFLHSNDYHDILTCKYVLFEFRNFVNLPY